MKRAGIILSAMHICGVLSVGNSQTSRTILGVTMALSDHFGPRTPAMTILRADELTWQDEREIFVVMKSMAFVQRKFSATFDFRSYGMMMGRKKKSMLSQGMSLAFGWHGTTKQEFEKLSRNVYLAESKWLLFLKSGQSPKEFMKDFNIYVNAHIIAAGITNCSRVELTDGYKILPYSPLEEIHLGNWNVSSHQLELAPVKPYPLRRTDLKGLRFRVSSTKYKPITMIRVANDSQIELGGLFGLVFNELSLAMNFTNTYVTPIENFTGTITRNGSWTGLIGMVQRNETDLILGPTSYKRRVLKVVGILRPLVRSYYQILFKSNSDVMDISAIFKPFQAGVWVATVIWTSIAAVIFGFVFRTAYNRGYEEKAIKYEFYNLSSLFVVCQALCQQGHHASPRSLASRICFLIAYVVSIVLVTSYSAILISDLTVDTPHRPFDSLETFLHEGKHKLLVGKQTPDYTYFYDANDELRRNIFRKFVQTVKQSESPKSIQGHIDKICEDASYAFFVTYEVVRFLAQDAERSKNCRILYLTHPLDRVFMSIATHKRAPYLTIMDYHIQRMTEAGLIHRIRMTLDFYQSNYDMYWKKVTLHQAFQIHTVLIVGMLLSVVVFAGEILLSRLRGLVLQKRSTEFPEKPKYPTRARKYNRYHGYRF